MTTEPEEAEKPAAPARRAFNVLEFCEVYGLGKDVVYDAIRDEKLVARKLGARTIITAEDADKFIASLPRLELPPTEKRRRAQRTRLTHQPAAQQRP